jgi:hypothetical protein
MQAHAPIVTSFPLSLIVLLEKVEAPGIRLQAPHPFDFPFSTYFFLGSQVQAPLINE